MNPPYGPRGADHADNNGGKLSVHIRRSNSEDAPEATTGVLEIPFGTDSTNAMTLDDIREASQVHSPKEQLPFTYIIKEPTAPRLISCHSNTDGLREKVRMFRLRDGDLDFVFTFLACSIGLDLAPDTVKAALTEMPLVNVPYHLVEVTRYTGGQSTPFKTRQFYCALTEPHLQQSATLRAAPEYHVLPPPACMDRISQRLNYNLILDTAWIIKCGTCGRRYEIDVYR